jgi:hypothetical protein
MRRLGVKRVVGLEAVCTCQILQLLSCFLTTRSLVVLKHVRPWGVLCRLRRCFCKS